MKVLCIYNFDQETCLTEGKEYEAVIHSSFQGDFFEVVNDQGITHRYYQTRFEIIPDIKPETGGNLINVAHNAVKAEEELAYVKSVAESCFWNGSFSDETIMKQFLKEIADISDEDEENEIKNRNS